MYSCALLVKNYNKKKSRILPCDCASTWCTVTVSSAQRLYWWQKLHYSWTVDCTAVDGWCSVFAVAAWSMSAFSHCCVLFSRRYSNWEKGNRLNCYAVLAFHIICDLVFIMRNDDEYKVFLLLFVLQNSELWNPHPFKKSRKKKTLRLNLFPTQIMLV